MRNHSRYLPAVHLVTLLAFCALALPKYSYGGNTRLRNRRAEAIVRASDRPCFDTSGGECDRSQRLTIRQIDALKKFAATPLETARPAPGGAVIPGALESDQTPTAEEVIKTTREETQKLRDRREQEQKAKLEAEQKRKDEGARKQAAEQEQKKKKEQEQKSKAEQEQKAKREQEQKAKREQEQKRKAEAEQKKKVEAEQKKKAEGEQKAKAANEQKRKQHVNITLPPSVNRSSWTGCTPLPGTGQVIPGSPLVRITIDLRGFLAIGEGIRIDKNDFRVVEPRDEVTLTLDHPWDGAPIANATMCRIEAVPHISRGCMPLPCTADVLEGSPTMRTSCDISSMVSTSDTVFVDNEMCKVTSPLTPSQLSCDRPWRLASSPAARLCRVIPRPWNGGMAAVTCCVTTTQGSAFVGTSVDLRMEISAGDTIRIRTEEFRVRPPLTNVSFWIDQPSRLASRSGLQAYKVAPCFPLSGVVGMAKGSALATTSRDLRDELSVGDIVEIGPEQFEVISPTDGYSLALSRSWEYQAASELTILKCPRSVQSGTRLPGSCAVVQGSRIVRTTEDLTDSISASDLVTIGVGGDTFQVVEPQDATTLTLNRPYAGPTAQLSCYRQPRSEKQRALEELAQKKMMCQSIYCLAKIEEEERAIAFSLPRSLSTLASSQWTGDDKKAKASSIMVDTDLSEDENLEGFIPPEESNGAGPGSELSPGTDAGATTAGSAAGNSANGSPGKFSNPDIDGKGNENGNGSDNSNDSSPDAMTSQVSSDGRVRGGVGIPSAGKNIGKSAADGGDQSGNSRTPTSRPGTAGAKTPVDVARAGSGGGASSSGLNSQGTNSGGAAATAASRSGNPAAPIDGQDSTSTSGAVDDDFNAWMAGQPKEPTAEETTKKAKAKAEAETPTSPAQDLMVNKQFRL